MSALRATYNSSLMSQITRCPACSTTFKVVADQLRISEGWVRCGQCKEVFDASAHLLAVAPTALLPDVSLTDVRPPPVPVARSPETGRVWGRSPSAPVPAPSNVQERPAAPGKPLLPADAGEPADTLQGRADAEAPGGAPVLDVPHPGVPAFLSAAGATADPQENFLARGAAPFAWSVGTDPARIAPAGDAPATPPRRGTDPAADAGAAAEGASAAVVTTPDPASPTPLPTLSAGYELPAAELPDTEEESAPLELASTDYPALELPPKPVEPPQDFEPKEPAPFAPSGVARTPEPLPSVDFVAPPVTQESDVLTLVEDRSPAAVLQSSGRKSSTPKEIDEADEDDTDGSPEVSFVVAARRKAFWRKPAVRAVLVLLVLLSLVGLALQIAVQERDRLVAMDARTKPWLMALCEPLRCDIAPQRQIADVVIDSSSFNKARGDSYQLALTMKSKAPIPLAMPAVELTLTDAQDQPVLRRVLLPTDLGAPRELPAGGDWSVSVSVIVTTGGARVAGYRLLAFYP